MEGMVLGKSAKELVTPNNCGTAMPVIRKTVPEFEWIIFRAMVIPYVRA
jgi:hypothetical protein